MSNPYFSFKQFTVYHDRCAMKVGADGVTLGAWADVAEAKHILDVGCGSGLITLMLAQRIDTEITAIDIDYQSVIQAKENIKRSPWKNRISVYHASFQDFSNKKEEKFDLIVCNPPFFVHSMKSASAARTTARHTDTLSHLELITNSQKCLSVQGKLCVILPVPEGNEFVLSAEKEGLFCTKKVSVFPNFEKSAKRLLLEFQKEKTRREETNLVIEKERNVYTPQYAELVKGFYLKL